MNEFREETEQTIDLYETDRVNVDDEDYAEVVLPKGGTCLITAGNTSSGKSTMHRALIHHLFTDEDVQMEFLNGQGEPMINKDLKDWILDFDRGEFPDRNVWNQNMDTFFIEFGQGRRMVNLSFFEISGEAFKKLIPGPDHPPIDLIKGMEDILMAKEVNKLFIFVTDSMRNGNLEGSRRDEDQFLFDDMMFSELLSQIRQLGIRRIRLLFVAAKWDSVAGRAQTPRRFFMRKFPSTRATLKRFSLSDVTYIRFSVGDVQKQKNSTGERVDTIMKHDPLFAARVANWIYHKACGRPLKGHPRVDMTLWERIKGWAAQ